MKKFRFKHNQLVKIRIDTQAEESERYASRVEDVGEKTITLAAPMFKGMVLNLPPGKSIWVELVVKDCNYRFLTVVVRQILQPIPLITVEKPVEIERWNRRRLFRLQVFLPISFRRGEEEVTGNTIDLSGNGFAALFPGRLEEPKPEDVLEFMLSLPNELLVGKARIVRKELRKPDHTCLMAEFQDWSEKSQDTIIAFLFAQQRKLRERGRP